MTDKSLLQKARYDYKPLLPELFLQDQNLITIRNEEPSSSIGDCQEIKGIFPAIYGLPVVSFTRGINENYGKKRRVGVLLSGGQAPGGHNVIAGLYDALKASCCDSVLYGFTAGTNGVLEGKYTELTGEIIDRYRNTGGFDMLLSGRTKIESQDHIDAAVATCRALDLDALVVIGGDDSNTNAAFLSKYFTQAGLKTQVIGVPKTIDGDLRSRHVEMTFGFDTTTKTYAEEISNLSRDTASAGKYWQFIKLMGRSASHITLECALLTQPNITLISEEVAERSQSLDSIIEYICSVIVRRAEKGLNFGTILIPEGLIEFIPEIRNLIAELNDVIAANPDVFACINDYDKLKPSLESFLSHESYRTLMSIPEETAMALLSERDPHGNVQVSFIDTEGLLAKMTSLRLSELKASGKYNGKFTPQLHFFGFEGRSAMPSNFDASYCYTLGFTAFNLIANGLTGYLSYVRNLSAEPKDWITGGIPLTMLMNMEKRNGSMKPVIAKALVDLNGKPYRTLCEHREEWAINTCYKYTGPIQFYGPPLISWQIPSTIILENE